MPIAMYECFNQYAGWFHICGHHLSMRYAEFLILGFYKLIKKQAHTILYENYIFI